MSKLTKNFATSEFACHDEHNTQVPSKYMKNVQLLADNLQVLRDDVDQPVFVISGYRTKKYNKAVGGAPESKHLKAEAGDITIKSMTPQQVYDRIEKLIAARKMKQGGLGLYAGWVHYDVRGRRARWRG
jgi:uncharacterized protein YcbK (DUF882 family)